MTHPIEERLQELGLALPDAAAPVANYVPWIRSGKLLIISGQVPLRDGRPAMTGRLGEELGIEQGIEAARLAALQILSQARAALGGDFSGLSRLLKLGGFVACTADFTDHPRVINGASDLMVQILGDAGRHARFAVGCASLPLGVPVEIEAMFEVA